MGQKVPLKRFEYPEYSLQSVTIQTKIHPGYMSLMARVLLEIVLPLIKTFAPCTIGNCHNNYGSNAQCTVSLPYPLCPSFYLYPSYYSYGLFTARSNTSHCKFAMLS